jgi:hypothetical protein
MKVRILPYKSYWADNRFYETGSVIELSDKEAARVIEAGFGEKIESEESTKLSHKKEK